MTVSLFTNCMPIDNHQMQYSYQFLNEKNMWNDAETIKPTNDMHVLDMPQDICPLAGIILTFQT